MTGASPDEPSAAWGCRGSGDATGMSGVAVQAKFTASQALVWRTAQRVCSHPSHILASKEYVLHVVAAQLCRLQTSQCSISARSSSGG